MSQETIEKKLEYLDQTKQLIGQALVTKGQTLDAETPFRDYVQKVLDIQTGYDTRDATAVASEVLKGKTFYNSQGKVEGTLVPKTGDIKKFETIEEMQADANAQEGDLAIVYRKETTKAQADSQFQVATFPATVVLPTAITDYIDIRYRAVDSSAIFDCWGMLDAQRFLMDCYTEEGSICVEYESSDGITYTRTDDGDEVIDFGTEIYYAYSDYWNDAIGYFLQVGGNTFDGLYQCENVVDLSTYKFHALTDITFEGTTPVFKEGSLLYDAEVIHNAINAVMSVDDTIKKATPATFIFMDEDTIAVLSSTGRGITAVYYSEELEYLGVGPDGHSTMASQPYRLVNLKTLEVSDSYTVAASDGIFSNFTPLSVWIHFNFSNNQITEITKNYDNVVYVGNTINYCPLKFEVYVLKYLLAPTQLTLGSSNELLPGKIAYGKNGIVEGSNKVYNNLKLAGYMEELNECQMDLVVSSYDNLNGKSITVGNDFNETTLSTTFHTMQKLSPTYDYYRMHSSCIIGYKTDTDTNTFYLALFDFKGNKLYEVNYTYTTGVEVLPYTDDNNVYILFRTWTDTSAQHYIKKISLNDYSSEDLADINISNKLYSYDSVVIDNNIYTIICLSGSTSKGYLYVNGAKICSFNGFNYDTEIVAVKGKYVYVVVSESRNNVFCIDIETATCTTITLYDNTSGSGSVDFCRSYKYDGLVGCTEYISSATQQGVIGQLTEEGTFEKIVDLPVTFGTGSTAIEKFCEIIDSNGKRWLYYNKLLNLETGEIVPLDENFLYTYITLVYCQDGMYRGIYNQNLVTFRPDIQLNNAGDKMLFKTLYSNSLSGDVNYYLVIDKHLDKGNSMTDEEYQTALDTAYSIRDDATE